MLPSESIHRPTLREVQRKKTVSQIDRQSQWFKTKSKVHKHWKQSNRKLMKIVYVTIYTEYQKITHTKYLWKYDKTLEEFFRRKTLHDFSTWKLKNEWHAVSNYNFAKSSENYRKQIQFENDRNKFNKIQMMDWRNYKSMCETADLAETVNTPC